MSQMGLKNKRFTGRKEYNVFVCALQLTTATTASIKRTVVQGLVGLGNVHLCHNAIVLNCAIGYLTLFA